MSTIENNVMNKVEEVIWKPVVGFELQYEVSNTGEVRNKITGYTISQRIDKYGYKRVELRTMYKDGDKTSKSCAVHRLVALTFLPNPENKPCIDHIDGNPSNNHVTNLRWVTYKENITNNVTKERMKNAQQKRLSKDDEKIKSKKVRQTEEFKKKYKEALNTPTAKINRKLAHAKHARAVVCIETGEMWLSVNEAAKANNAYNYSIEQSCNRHEENKPTYKWIKRHYRYATKEEAEEFYEKEKARLYASIGIDVNEHEDKHTIGEAHIKINNALEILESYPDLDEVKNALIYTKELLNKLQKSICI